MKRIALERKEYANDVCIAHYFAAGDTYVSLPLPGGSALKFCDMLYPESKAGKEEER
jgi:hypothetical protein